MIYFKIRGIKMSDIKIKEVKVNDYLTLSKLPKKLINPITRLYVFNELINNRLRLF